MATSFCCILYRTDVLSEKDVGRAFGTALAGFSVPAPVVTIAAVRSLAGWSAAFYSSGLKLPSYEELDHACDLFEEELPPGLCARDAAGRDDAVVYALVYSDEVMHDDAWRFGASSLERRFVREGETGLEAGMETLDDERIEALPSEEEAEVGPHRGSTFLSRELGAPVLAALVGALFEADRRVEVTMVGSDASSIAEEAGRLNRVLGRTDGCGAAPFPADVSGAVLPVEWAAFAACYDWADPTDSADLYRELAIGKIVGTLRFMRPSDVGEVAADPELSIRLSEAGAYPIAWLRSSALGAPKSEARVVALARDRQSLLVVSRAGPAREAGPTFGELLRYLSLGFSTRDEIQEDLIQALMLRAHVRATSC